MVDVTEWFHHRNAFLVEPINASGPKCDNRRNRSQPDDWRSRQAANSGENTEQQGGRPQTESEPPAAMGQGETDAQDHVQTAGQQIADGCDDTQYHKFRVVPRKTTRIIRLIAAHHFQYPSVLVDWWKNLPTEIERRKNEINSL